MAAATITNSFRQMLAARMFAEVAEMGFGNGGHNSDNTARTPDPAQAALASELLRKAVATKTQENACSVTATGRIEAVELEGYSISEAGLYDGSGNLLGFCNFAPKTKEADEAYDIKIMLVF